MKRHILFLIFLFILGEAAHCPAQDFSIRMSAAGVLPATRSFAGVEFRQQIAPRYSLGIAGEIGPEESNVSPKLAVKLSQGISLEAGFGWGHKFQKEGIDDHNFHTYTLGLTWERRIGRRWTFFAGPSMFWRSYQAHIGFHVGTMRIAAGAAFELRPKTKTK